MNDLEIIKDKIRKLLSLSKSDNENEATIALEKANNLIEKYNINEDALRFESLYIKSTKILVPWRIVVAGAVSWLYSCYLYRNPELGQIIFTGESLDVFLASEMNTYLIKTIERCSKKNIRKNAKYKFRRDFKYGMACNLYDRIMILGESCSWAPQRNVNLSRQAGFNPVPELPELNKKFVQKELF